ncbi:MAG: response regulator transcription factor [Candidatus Kapaibacterium sp.]|jgi:DNA-binding response OmpR family regulator
MPTVLIIEDESKVARFVQRGLLAEGFTTEIAETGDEGLRKALQTKFDVITVDLLLPGLDGISLIRTLRERKSESSILVLSARDSLKEKLLGFEVGADDYLPKPFAFEELVARIKALVRRREVAARANKLTYHDLEVDLTTREVLRAGNKIDLSPREFSLLEFFLRNPERAQSKPVIAQKVWNDEIDQDSNIVEVYMMYLRKKIDLEDSRPLFHTIRGVGYILRDDILTPKP